MIDLFAAFLIAVLAGLGVGGGGLLVIYLTFFSDMTAHTAQGLNLAFFICAAAASMPFHIRRLRGHLPGIGLLLIGGIAGAVFGSLLSHALSSEWLRIIFGAFLIIAGLFFSGKNKGS